MHVRLRVLLIPILAAGTLLASGGPSAHGHDCGAGSSFHPGGPNWCHATPRPATPPPATPPPATPAPPPPPQATAPPPQPQTTPAPARRATPRPARAPATVSQLPDEDVSDTDEVVPIELDLEPVGEPELIVQGPVEDPSPTPEEFDAEPAAAAHPGTILITFLMGFLIGGIVGRASWGVRRRKKQQIFG